MRPFEAADAVVFVGRDPETQTLLEALVARVRSPLAEAGDAGEDVVRSLGPQTALGPSGMAASRTGNPPSAEPDRM